MKLIIHVRPFSTGSTIRRKVEVESLEDAAAKWNELVDSEGFGASAMRGSCGAVANDDGTLAGVISYNGRITKAVS